MTDAGDHVDRAVQQIGGPPGRVVAHGRRPLADGDHDPHRTIERNRTRLEAGESRHFARDQCGAGLDRGPAVETEHLPALGTDKPSHVLDGASTTFVGIIAGLVSIGSEPIRTSTDHGVEFGGGRADERFVQHCHRDGGRTSDRSDHTERGTATDPDPYRRTPLPARRPREVDCVKDDVDPFDDEVDLGLEIHGVFAPPVSRANDAVNPPTGRAERCLGDRERLGSDPDAVHEHDIGAVSGARLRTHVGEVVEMFGQLVEPTTPLTKKSICSMSA